MNSNWTSRLGTPLPKWSSVATCAISSKIDISNNNDDSAGQKGRLDAGLHHIGCNTVCMLTKSGLCLAVSLAALLQSPLQCVCLNLFWMSKHARITSLMVFVRHAGQWQKERVDCVCFWSDKTIPVCLKSCGQQDVLLSQSTSSPLPYIRLHNGLSHDIPAPYMSAPRHMHWYSS